MSTSKVGVFVYKVQACTKEKSDDIEVTLPLLYSSAFVESVILCLFKVLWFLVLEHWKLPSQMPL